MTVRVKVDGFVNQDVDDQQRDRRDARRPRRPHRGRRRAPRLGLSRARASTTTAPAAHCCSRPRSRWPSWLRPRQQGAVHLLQRRGAGPARLGLLRLAAVEEADREHLGDARLRHARVGQLRALHLRRQRRRAGLRRPEGLGHDRAGLQGLLGQPGPGRTRRSRSTGARTTTRSPRPASRRAASSPAPRRSRPRTRSRSTAAPRAWRSTRATTSSATRWPTSTCRASSEHKDAAVHAIGTFAPDDLVGARHRQGVVDRRRSPGTGRATSWSASAFRKHDARAAPRPRPGRR